MTARSRTAAASLTIDDEGTPTSRTTLIEDGILTGFIQDRQNARLMNMRATGNGRRQSYAHSPMPRMTNTIMLAGDATREDMIKSVKRGLYAVNFGGGQVDITSGKFVFSASEAYLIEDGKITSPVKGATLIGNGPDALTKVEMIGNDPELDPGVGTCGKNGQGVPVGVGQPTHENLRPDHWRDGGLESKSTSFCEKKKQKNFADFGPGARLAPGSEVTKIFCDAFQKKAASFSLRSR